MSSQRMSSADAAWLHMDRPTNLMVVNALMWFDEPLDLERAREVVRERLVERFPRFRQRVAEPRLGSACPAGRTTPTSTSTCTSTASRCPRRATRPRCRSSSATSWPRRWTASKPLWDMYLVDGYGSGRRVLTRMHHCIADGIALARVLLSLTDERPTRASRRRREHDGRAAGRRRGAPARTPRGGAPRGLRVVVHPRRAARPARGAPTPRARKLCSRRHPVRAQGRARRRRTVTGRPDPLDEVKAIGHGDRHDRQRRARRPR